MRWAYLRDTMVYVHVHNPFVRAWSLNLTDSCVTSLCACIKSTLYGHRVVSSNFSASLIRIQFTCSLGTPSNGTRNLVTVHTWLCSSALVYLPAGLVAVHCTHGLNRTGYLVCRLVLDSNGLQPIRFLHCSHMRVHTRYMHAIGSTKGNTCIVGVYTCANVRQVRVCCDVDNLAVY